MVFLGALRVLAAAVAVISPSPAPSSIPEITHVVTSDRSDETLRNATRTTYVVDAATIARRGYLTVSDALANVPGVEIARYGAIGSNASYGIRGSSSAQVLVLVNGMPAGGGFANTVALSTMSTSGVRRIEVVEGGGSTLYGTGAIGGIINVITDSQAAPASATIRLGSFGERSLAFSDKGLSFERVVSQNAYDLPASENIISGLPNPTSHQNSDYEATTVRYGLDRTYGAVSLAFRASLENDHLGAPADLNFTSLTSREDDLNTGASLVLNWNHAQSQQTAEFGGSREQVLFGCDSSGVDPNCFLQNPALTSENRVDLSLHNRVSGARERLIYGADLSRGTVRSDDGFGDIANDALAQSAFYAQENWQAGNGELYAGIRAERDGSLGGAISPSLGWRTSLGRSLEFKANAAGAFRAPNASELYFPGYGNPALAPERAVVGDLALTERAWIGGVTLGWFTNRTNDLIVATQDPKTGLYAPQNVAHGFVQGFTFDAKTLPSHGVTASLGLTDLYRAENIDSLTRLPNDPVLSATLGLELTGHRSGIFDGAGVSMRSVSPRGFVDRSQPLFNQPAEYSALDAYARFRVSPHLLLTVRGANLGNERYAEISDYPMPGRSFAIELSTK